MKKGHLIGASSNPPVLAKEYLPSHRTRNAKRPAQPGRIAAGCGTVAMKCPAQKQKGADAWIVGRRAAWYAPGLSFGLS
jgi:hypothetical protein